MSQRISSKEYALQFTGWGIAAKSVSLCAMLSFLPGSAVPISVWKVEIVEKNGSSEMLGQRFEFRGAQEAGKRSGEEEVVSFP